MNREQAINYLISSGFTHEQVGEVVRALTYEPTTKSHLTVREFEEIEVSYPPEELCTYPEYKGKPYFGIKYKEKGEEIVGYGTYNPKVLSQYLRDYFISATKKDCNTCTHSDEIDGSNCYECVKDMCNNYESTTKNNLGVDCISRADAIQAMQDKAKKLKNEDTINGLCGAVAILYEMSSVTPQEPTDKKFTKADIDAIVKAINEGWELRVNEILSKIRAEIEKLRPNLRPEQMTDYDYAMVEVVDDIVAIIDKHKAEMEDKK